MSTSITSSQLNAASAQHVGFSLRWRPPPCAIKQQLQLHSVRGFVAHNSLNRDKPFISRQRTSGMVQVATPSSSLSTSTEVSTPESATSTSQPADQQQQQQQQQHAKPLVFSSGSFVLPHPDKVAKGGEDWYFIADNKRAMGVADGVGGWAELGVDAGAYARLLMNSARDAAEKAGSTSTSSSSSSGNGSSHPHAAAAPRLSAQDILETAYSKATVLGSSTACVIVLNGSTLIASNLGDSGFMVVRDGDMLMATTQQQHSFNFPYQIGGKDAMGDSPRQAQRYEVELQPGDILVVGTDGLWDNVFHEEMLSVIKFCKEKNMRPHKAAHVMGHYARHRAADTKFASPFAYSAYQAGIKYLGGKMDDITVLIAYVEPEPERTLAKL